MYWRKANAIHDWFVQNCQDGVDECQYSNEISAEQLAELVSLCETELASDHKGDLLTPASGFFFGGTEVDEWYIQDLKQTAERLELVIKAIITSDLDDVRFYYRSSW